MLSQINKHVPGSLPQLKAGSLARVCWFFDEWTVRLAILDEFVCKHQRVVLRIKVDLPNFAMMPEAKGCFPVRPCALPSNLIWPGFADC